MFAEAYSIKDSPRFLDSGGLAVEFLGPPNPALEEKCESVCNCIAEPCNCPTMCAPYRKGTDDLKGRKITQISPVDYSKQGAYPARPSPQPGIGGVFGAIPWYVWAGGGILLFMVMSKDK